MPRYTKTELDTLVNFTHTTDRPIYYDTYSPGDGMTRYKFSKENVSYFAMNRPTYCEGLTQAIKFMRGYCEALDY